MQHKSRKSSFKRRVPGVTACSVSLLMNSMGVEGTANADAVIAAVKHAGYGASLKVPALSGNSFSAPDDTPKARETSALNK